MKTNSDINTWTVTNEEQKGFNELKETLGWVEANEILMVYKFKGYTKQFGPDNAKEMLSGKISEMKLYRSIAAPKYKGDYDKIIAFGEQLMK